jgi:hypothetical protein
MKSQRDGRVRLSLCIQWHTNVEERDQGEVSNGNGTSVEYMVRAGVATRVVLQRDKQGVPSQWLTLTIQDVAAESGGAEESEYRPFWFERF